MTPTLIFLSADIVTNSKQVEFEKSGCCKQNDGRVSKKEVFIEEYRGYLALSLVELFTRADGNPKGWYEQVSHGRNDEEGGCVLPTDVADSRRRIRE